MKFVVKGKDGKVLHLEVEQDLEMWEKGYLTLYDGEWIDYEKMENLIPVYQRERSKPEDV